MRAIALFLLSGSTSTWAQETVSGDMHAVINSGGTITYYLKIKPDSTPRDTAPTLDKTTIKELISSSPFAPKVFEIAGKGSEVAGYYVATDSSENSEPLQLAIKEGYTAKVIPYNSLPESFGHAYKFSTPEGETGGAWLPASNDSGASALSKLMPTEWSTSSLTPTSQATKASSSIPIPEDELIESIRDVMLRQAISLACKSKNIPREISVTASIGASASFIVSAEGSIAFQATWETAHLCSS